MESRRGAAGGFRAGLALGCGGVCVKVDGGGDLLRQGVGDGIEDRCAGARVGVVAEGLDGTGHDGGDMTGEPVCRLCVSEDVEVGGQARVEVGQATGQGGCDQRLLEARSEVAGAGHERGQGRKAPARALRAWTQGGPGAARGEARGGLHRGEGTGPTRGFRFRPGPSCRITWEGSRSTSSAGTRRAVWPPILEATIPLPVRRELVGARVVRVAVALARVARRSGLPGAVQRGSRAPAWRPDLLALRPEGRPARSGVPRVRRRPVR